MFDNIPEAPADAIFGLVDAFRKDSSAVKINLGVGVYQDESGNTPILGAVKAAERRVLASEVSKSYVAIEGDPDYRRLVLELLLGPRHPAVLEQRCAVAHTPGGTGAIRIFAELLRHQRSQATIWLPDPTWVNHAPIFRAAELPTRTYRYLDADRRRIALDPMLADLSEARDGDVVVLHGCCHNPSGIDPTAAEWRDIAERLAGQSLVPLVDFAYQGFARGIEEDLEGLLEVANRVPELVICASFSKNFALYNERVGTLVVMTQSPASARAVLSQVKQSIRTTYSNPPAHGAAIVRTILSEPELRAGWQNEVDAMRHRIQEMRQMFVQQLDERNIHLAVNGNGFLMNQFGMFSFSGLDRDAILRLRESHSVYIVDSGRINFAGITPANVQYLCDSIAKVIS